jgi:predicted transcriptional regulator of viral defense system
MRQTEQFFAEHPVFTLEQFAATVGKRVSTDVAYRHLAYFGKAGRVKRLRNALYAVVTPGVASDTYTPDPYLVAASAGRGDPLGYHTALELLGVAQSVFRTKTVVSSRRSSSFTFGDYQVEFVRPSAALGESAGFDLGATSIDYAGAQLRITGRERTLVDCLTQPGRAGGLEEVLDSVMGFGVLDLAGLESYLRALNLRRAWAVTGYFLEKRQNHLFVPDEVLERWEGERPQSRQYWMRDQRGGFLASRWNLVVPETVGTVLGD